MTAGQRKISILGCTGSIGSSTLALLAENADAYAIQALTAHNNVEKLAAIAIKWRAKFAVIGNETLLPQLRTLLADYDIDVAGGEAGLIEAASMPSDWLMSAIVGAAGLMPTCAAVQRGAIIALANKESLVCGGSLMINEAAKFGATLLPADSEHSAIFQALAGNRAEDVEKLIVTASGGPFRTWSLEQMRKVTLKEALAHPNWSMGVKITIDSATMMNKGLELIEAHHLFAMPEDKIDVCVHPQSIVHSLVAYRDGSVMAQLGPPDMRVPIAHTLAWPKRMQTSVPRLDLAALARLDFEEPDQVRFPALRLAREAMRSGEAATTTLNAANEEAQQAFIQGRIGFLQIMAVVEDVLARLETVTISTIADILEVDINARRHAQAIISTLQPEPV